MSADELAADLPLAADPVLPLASDAEATSRVEDAASGPSLDPGDASLLALVDRLGVLLDRSDLSELAVSAGGTRLVLRKPTAFAPPVVAGSAVPAEAVGGGGSAAGASGTDAGTAGGVASP